jgi:hypothetical protein
VFKGILSKTKSCEQSLTAFLLRFGGEHGENEIKWQEAFLGFCHK